MLAAKAFGGWLVVAGIHFALQAGRAKITKRVNGVTERTASENPSELENFRRALNHESFSHLVAGVADYAIFLLDAQGYVMSWNSGAERSKGYRAGEIIGRHFSVFYPAEAIEKRRPERALGLAIRNGRFA
ncbi:MAG TPA: PAS domain S-box protein, partial [Chthoniobacterales bacterium]|nr:PAS domain S-box protein [Chthoniobacterales bacterium]